MSTPLDDFLAFTLTQEMPQPTHGVLPSGVAWRCLGTGVLVCEPVAPTAISVVVSAGIHGDETAPIEIISALLGDIASGAILLRVRLLVLLGNVAAMKEGRRYLDDDLNRLFSGRHHALPQSRETARAAELEAVVGDFFSAAVSNKTRWHLDLHTAIRPSLFERFALLPQRAMPYGPEVFTWLGALGIEAALLHRSGSGTFAHFSCSEHQALACTLELGKVMPFGQNDLARYASVANGLCRLISGESQPVGASLPRVFDVVASLDKQSEAFQLWVDNDTPNFTAYPRGTLLAQDGDYRYEVTHDEERIVFPNPRVKVGLRAGLMVAERMA